MLSDSKNHILWASDIAQQHKQLPRNLNVLSLIPGTRKFIFYLIVEQTFEFLKHKPRLEIWKIIEPDIA